MKKICNGYLLQRLLDITIANQVKRNIYLPSLLRNCISKLVNSPFIEGIHERDLNSAALRADRLSDLFESRLRATGE